MGAFGHPGAIFGPSDIKNERFFDTPILDPIWTPFWTSQECENGALVFAFLLRCYVYVFLLLCSSSVRVYMLFVVFFDDSGEIVHTI